MRLSPLLLVLLLAACGRAEREREAAVAAAQEATFVEVERALAQSIQRANRVAGSAERILRPLPVMTPSEEDGLRRFRNAVHVNQAQASGVRVGTDSARDSLLANGDLIQLEDSTQYWIVRRGSSPAHVIPQMRTLLGILGERFQNRLADMGIPPYRIEITSALRTSERQEELRGSNANAAAGLSSHEFGATVDLSYAAFAPPRDVPEEVLASVPARLAPHVERFTYLALESVSGRKSRELGAIFSRVLREAQDEGLALVIYERQQTVYHLTVAGAPAN